MRIGSSVSKELIDSYSIILSMCMIGVLPIALWIFSMIFQACPCPKASDLSVPLFQDISFLISDHAMKTSLQGLDTSAIREGYEPKPSATAKGRRSVKSSNSGFFAWMIPTGGWWWWWCHNRAPLAETGIENSRTNGTDWATFLNGARQVASAPARFYLSLHASEWYAGP